MKPLQHLTILGLSRVLACPFASMILAELGATVIKVEQPGAPRRKRSRFAALRGSATVRMPTRQIMALTRGGD